MKLYWFGEDAEYWNAGASEECSKKGHTPITLLAEMAVEVYELLLW
jgi:hypothetical protein